MVYRILADLVVVVHLLFVIFAVLGGLLMLRRRNLVWIHLPAALWAAWIEFAGWVCPLTPLENWLRAKGSMSAYSGDFIEQYLLPVLYPSHLTRAMQVVLGAFALTINLCIYWRVFGRTKRRPSSRKH